MNAFVLKTMLAVVLPVASSVLLAADDTQPAEAPDQVVASFDRLLNHKASFVAPAKQAAPKEEVDPLRASVNAVLWKQASSRQIVRGQPVRDPSRSSQPAPQH